MVRFEWVVSDSAQARVARVQAARFLVHVRVGDVEHQPLGVATLQLSLERIGTSMSEVSVAEEEVSQARERLTSLVCRRQIAVAFIDRIARCESISGSGRAEWDITWCKCVQISSCDESAERATQVRNAQRGVTRNFSLVCSVVLLDSRLLQADRYSVDCWQSCKASGHYSAVEGCGPRLKRSRSRITVGIDVSFGNPLVEWVGCDWISNALCCRGRIGYAIATAEDGFVRQAECNTNPGREIVFVHPNQSATHIQSRLSRSDDAESDYSRVEVLQCLIRRDDESALQASRGVNKVRIEVRHEIVVLDEWRHEFITKSKVQREPRRDFPVILNKEALLPVVNIHWGARSIDVRDAGWRQSNQEVCEWIGAAAGVGHGATRIAAVYRKTIDGSVANEVSAHLNAVLTKHPRKGVSEGHQILIQGTIGVAAAVRERGEAIAKADCRMPKCIEFRRSHDVSVGVDLRL